MFIANSKYIIGLFRYALSPLRNKGLNDDSEDEDNELPNLDHQDDPSIPRPPSEPPDVEKCLEPEAGTDISKITRKPSKTGKHGHGKRKSTREAKDSKLKPKKVNFSQLWVNKSQLTRRQIPKYSI
ncbi:hypothetical protein Tco_1124140 [Tanacetum coccineum]|uniref:Uncharacterized protein n=1 Tax=Tanacetum coccineum TaxID=301880 RepID=A0ABQ5J5G4_9ASTR